MAAEPKRIPIYIKFPIASVSGIAAALVVHPLDVVKNYMQLSGVGDHSRISTLATAKGLFHDYGIKGFYKGLTANILRQTTYGGGRVGTYMYLLDTYNQEYNTPPGFHTRMLFGSMGGFFGSIVGTPSEVVLIRMTGDHKLPPEQRRNYKHALDALKQIGKNEGISGLWTGFTSTMARAIVANAVELGSYSQSKEYFLSRAHLSDDFKLHVVCSLIATFINCCFSLPFDVAKTRIQNQTMADNIPEFKGPFDVMYKVFKAEGPTALWKGFTPSFICIAPRNIIIFLLVENFSKLYKVIVMKDKTDPKSGL